MPNTCHISLLLESRARGSVQRLVTPPRAGRLLISSRRPEFNQHSRVTCGKFSRPELASRGWKHKLSGGDHFTIQRLQERPPEPESSFTSLGLEPELVSALGTLGITCPTWVQLQSIPPLLRGSNVLSAAETGSGKTLCYLLPIVHRLRALRVSENSKDPRSLVLVPSRELARQVGDVARSLGGQLGMKVRSMGGGRGHEGIKRQLGREPIDILVATPGTLWKALQRDTVNLGELTCIVLDEADTLFDASFSGLVEKILMQTRIASHPTELQGPERKAQLVVIGATFPGGVGQVLSKVTDLGSIFTIKSKRLHFLMSHVKQTFLKIKGAEKISELLNLLKKRPTESPGPGVLVFCNSSKTVNWLGYILDDHGIKHSRLQGQMPAAMRVGIFEAFQKGQADVLLCTDIASRGLDSRRVEVVVNYDFPPTLQDYLHRVGRVGRVGSEAQGSVVSFVTHAWDVELVQKIETAARRKSRLPGMESAIKEPVPTEDLIKENPEQ
ncbi:hypothetical protein FKM82_024193 [Ascaphus truei]